jgi:AmiR/NasT family two-component response regulator
VASIQRYDQCRQLADNLRIALDSRAVIEQAKGVLMATRGLGPDAGFELLREESQRRNIKLRLVAEEVVRATLDAAEK